MQCEPFLPASLLPVRPKPTGEGGETPQWIFRAAGPKEKKEELRLPHPSHARAISSNSLLFGQVF